MQEHMSKIKRHPLVLRADGSDACDEEVRCICLEKPLSSKIENAVLNLLNKIDTDRKAVAQNGLFNSLQIDRSLCCQRNSLSERCVGGDMMTDERQGVQK